ncbi:MAG: hypothetical protein ACPHRO_09780 [Nannocystaceae bacterium]
MTILNGWARLDPKVDTSLSGLVIVDSFDRPAAAGLDVGGLLANGARVVELVTLRHPLWRTLVGLGESGAVPARVGARGVEWRSLGFDHIEHWRCRAPCDVAVTVGTFAGEPRRRSP